MSDVRMQRAPSDEPQAIADYAETALHSGEEEAAIPLVRAAAERHSGPDLWHWLGLLHRSIDEHEQALSSFDKAAELAPRGPRIAQARAHTAMEAGLPAVELYERALELAPQDASVIVGLAAARHAAGEGERAAADLASILEQAPMWTYGHEQLAQFQCTLGRPSEATASLERAIRRFPAAQQLWESLLFVQLRRGTYEALREILDRARAAGVQSDEFAIFEAIHSAEFDETTYPEALFEQAPRDRDVDLDRWRFRHLLRVGEPTAALSIVDRAVRQDPSSETWAYAATIWRLAGDPRSEWLEGDPRIVSVIDLADRLPPLGELATALRTLHVARGEYLDQSVRGGTQTDGPLFCRIDPVIRRVRSAVVAAVQEYVAQLPPADPGHPLLGQRRDRRIRFSGSWSVRLRSGGRHSNHIHPQGWISSALYVSLPPKSEGEGEDAGWLTLGQPDDKLELRFDPFRKIEPKPGQLVLFPSWMWHGTVPFAEGERLTVAFDVRPPI
jgi:tetratricopeptide (TPR) repeat protein